MLLFVDRGFRGQLLVSFNYTSYYDANIAWAYLVVGHMQLKHSAVDNFPFLLLGLFSQPEFFELFHLSYEAYDLCCYLLTVALEDSF